MNDLENVEISKYEIRIHTSVNGSLYLYNSKGQKLYSDFSGGIIMSTSTGTSSVTAQVPLTLGEEIWGEAYNTSSSVSNRATCIIDKKFEVLDCVVKNSPFELTITTI